MKALKHFIIIFLFITNSVELCAQNFVKSHTKFYSQEILADALFDDVYKNWFFCSWGDSKNNGHDTRSSFITKTNNNGQVIKETKLSFGDTSFIVCNFFKKDNSIILFGIGKADTINSESSTSLITVTCNNNLDIINITAYKLNQPNIQINNLITKKDELGKYISVGNVLTSGSYLFYAKFDEYGKLLTIKMDSVNTFTNELNGDFIFTPIGYKIFATNTEFNVFETDTNFHIIKADTLYGIIPINSDDPDSIYKRAQYLNPSFLSWEPYSAKKFNADYYLVVGIADTFPYWHGVSKSHLQIAKISNNNRIVDKGDLYIPSGTHWMRDMDQLTTASWQSIDFIDTNNIMVVQSEVVGSYNISGNDSHVQVGCFSSNLKLKWQTIIGGDAFYSAERIIATQDSGCLLLLKRFDTTNATRGIFDLDMYVVKLNKQGFITGVNEIYKPEENIIVYPNPGNEKIYLNKNIEPSELFLYNILGEEVLHQQINSQEYDVSNLHQGTYIYVFKTNSKVILKGKWIKE